MESNALPVSMVMTHNDAVEMTFVDGSRVQLSPCGACFIYDPPFSEGLDNTGLKPRHPLYSSVKTQQRTCFVTSSCRSKVMVALEFRNRFSSRPFLCAATNQGQMPLELYTDITKVEWSSTAEHCMIERQPDQSIQMTSVDSLATISLSPNGQDFSVKFLCKLQPEDGQTAMANREGDIPLQKPGAERLKCPSTQDDKENHHTFHQHEHIQQCSNWQEDPNAIQRRLSRECELQATRSSCKFWYQWVVQTHSVSHCPWYWRHPLDLLLHHRSNSQRTLEHARDVEQVTLEDETYNEQKPATHSTPVPRSLQLSCEHAHLHRHHWSGRHQQFAPKGDEDSLAMYGRKVSILYLSRVIYRLFWKGGPAIEIYPGNGDVISSCDGRGSFFRLVRVDSGGALQELMISSASPPPNVHHSSYSIADIVRRGARLLQCMHIHQGTSLPEEDLCCWKKMEQEDISSVSCTLSERSIIPGLGQLEAYSNDVFRGYFNDEVTIEMKRSSQAERDSGFLHQMDESKMIYRVLQPSGNFTKIDPDRPGQYTRHVRALHEWGMSIRSSADEKLVLALGKYHLETMDTSNMVQAELSRIQRFRYINEQEARFTSPMSVDRGSRNHSGSIAPLMKSERAENKIDNDVGLKRDLHKNETGSLTDKDVTRALQETAHTLSTIERLLGGDTT